MWIGDLVSRRYHIDRLESKFGTSKLIQAVLRFSIYTIGNFKSFVSEILNNRQIYLFQLTIIGLISLFSFPVHAIVNSSANQIDSKVTSIMGNVKEFRDFIKTSEESYSNQYEGVSDFSLGKNIEGTDIDKNFVVAQAVLPTLTITNNFGDEWDSDGNMDVNIALSSASSTNVTFKYSIEDITTTKGEDYTEKVESERTVTINAGTTSDSFTIPVINDALYEGNETFKLILSNLVGANFSAGNELSQIFTIRDNEGPTVSFANTPLRVQENVAGGKYVVTVKLSNPYHSRINFPYSIQADGSASASNSDRDFVSRNFVPLTFIAGETEQTIEIDIINDDRKESNETFSIEFTKIFIGNFTINFSLPDGPTSQRYNELVTIIDDESIQISADSFTIAENGGSFRGKVILGTQPSHGFRGTLEVRAGTATVGVNYSALVITGAEQTNWINRTGPEYRLQFRTTPTNEFTFEIPIIDNSIYGGNKTFELILKDLRRDGDHPIGNVAGFPNGGNSYSQTVTIVEDDLEPVLAVTNSTFKFVEDDTNSIALTLGFVPSLTTPASFSVATSTNGSAIAGQDFNAIDTSYNVPNSGTFSVPITLRDDSIIESDETFTITLSNLIGLRFSGGERLKTYPITIVDDDSTILSISSDSLSVAENVSDGEHIIKYNLSSATSVPVTFDYSLSGGTAEKVTDFTEPINRTVTIPVGSTTGSFTIPIVNDAIHELDETFTITFKNLVGASLTSGTATISRVVTVTDDDEPTLVIPANPTSFLVAEDSPNDKFIVNLPFSKALLHPISVTIETTNGTAIVGQDFVADDGTPKEFSSTTDKLPVTISSINDTATEGNESFSFRITSLTGAKFPDGVTSYSGTVTIIDDESSTLSITNTEFYVEEDVTGGNFDVNLSLSSAVGMDVTLEFNMENVEDQTAIKGSDYTQDSNNVISFEAGQTTKTISIPITDDGNVEGNESFTLILSNLIGAKFVNNVTTLSQEITIFDDNAPEVTITADNYNIAEDGGKFTFSLVVDGTYKSFKFSLSTSHGTAMGADFSDSFEDEYTYRRNSTNPTLAVDISDDDILEGDETFSISLVITQGAVRLPKGSPTYSKIVTIVDDESTTLSVKNTRFDVLENIGQGGFILRVGLSNSIAIDASVEYDLMDVTTSKASSRSDYTERPIAQRNTTIIAGNTIGTFTIPIVNDTRLEGNETFKIVLKNPVGAVFANGATLEVTITIVDDEYPTVLPPISTFVAEDVATEKIDLSLSLSGESTRSIAVNYETVDDSAIKGEDYTYQVGTLNFSPGITESKFSIPILNDSNHEGLESFKIRFIVTIGDAKFAGGKTTNSKTIYINDDETPTLSIVNTKFYVSEDVGNNGFSLELALSGFANTQNNVELNFAVTGGTAIKGVDYNSSSQKVRFSSSELKKIVSIGIIDDSIVEGNKTLRITLTNLRGAVFAGGGSSLMRTITIVDDERTTLSLATTLFKVNEDAASGKFNVDVMLAAASPYDVSFTVSTEDGTAIKDQDYTALVNESVTIEAGDTTRTFSIPIINDTDNEGEQSFNFKIENVVGAMISEGVEYIEKTITIVDDDVATIYLDQILSIGSIIEGYGDYNLELEISVANYVPISINFSSTPGTARNGTDYIAPVNQTITNTAGSDNISLSGFSFPDNSEGDREKTFSINLSITSGAVFLGGDTQKTIEMTIVDDDKLRLTPSVSSNFVDEDAGSYVINYTLSAAISTDITFRVRLGNPNRPGYTNATKGVDYEDLDNHIVTISPGETSGSISISILEDSITEPVEIFRVEFINLSHGSFPVENPQSWTKYVSINKNDLPTLSITNEKYSVIEDAGTFDLNLMISQLSAGTVAFKLHYLNGDTDTAVAGTHYHQDSQRHIFFLGQTTRIFPIQIINALSTEGNKSFTFSLEILSGAIYPADAQIINGEKRIVKTVTIIDDEPPAVEIDNNESDFTLTENGGNLVINYTLGSLTTHDVTFKYDLIDVTTTKNSDYIEAEEDEREITISAGRTTGSFTIQIIDDVENEGNETFTLVLSDLDGASVFLGNDIEYSKTVTIIDNEVPTLSIVNTELSIEENIEAGKIDLEVKLSGPTTDLDPATNKVVTFDYALTDGTATVAGLDYMQPDSRRFSIPEGGSTTTISIPILDDTTSEGNETFDITLNITSGAKFADGRTAKTQTITILDNELPTLSFQTTPISAIENVDSTRISVGVQLSGIPHQDVTFSYDMADVTATKRVDYVEEGTRTATISAGSSSGSFSIPIIDDLYNEGNETFNLTLSNLSNAVFADDAASISKIVTIQDNELPILLVKTEEFIVDEDDEDDSDDINNFVIRFELSGPTGQDVTFDYNLTDITTTKESDYTGAEEDERTIVIAQGEASGSITIPILDDSRNEGDETFTFTLSNLSGAVLESGEATLSRTAKIVDDELPTLKFSTTTFSVFEDVGSRGYVIEFELTGTTEEDVTFKYALSGGNATKVTDYTEADESERMLTIAGGETIETISIPIIDDLINEENELFTITLSNLSGAVFESGSELSETITILDNDSITLSVSTTNFNVNESDENVDGGNSFVVDFVLSGTTALDVTFEYDLTDVSANKGVDYLEEIERTVTIPAGSTTGSISIHILDDFEIEGSQSFTLEFSELKGAVFANNAKIPKTIVIIDDETPVISVTTTNFDIAEEANSFEVEVELLEASLDDVLFEYSTTNISAEKGLDYTDSSGIVTIRAGETTGSFSVPIIDDTDHEQSQTFRIDLTGRGTVRFDSDTTSLLSLTVTILDNEVPILTISGGDPVTESDTVGSPAQARFTILSPVQPATNNFTVQYTPTSTSFALNSGMKTTSHALDFSDADGDGIFTAELRIDIASDFTPELNEYLDVMLNADNVGSEKYYVGTTASATVFVVDDDAGIPELSLESITEPIAESARSVVFNILASVAPRRELTVKYTPSEVGGGDFFTDAVATATSTSVRFQSLFGRVKGTIMVDLNDDTDAESTGMIKVTLNADPALVQTYTVIAGDKSFSTATILDNDAPELSIANGPLVKESDLSGSPAQAIFTISSPVQPATNNFTVQYTPTSTNFVANSGTKTTSNVLDFADVDNDGIFTAELRVDIVSDGTPELNEYLEVVLNPDTVGAEKYFIGSSTSASIYVEDDDASIPELSLVTISNPVAESMGSVDITIIASEAPKRDVTVRYTPAEVGQGDFFTDTVTTATDTLVSFQNVGGLEQATITVNLDNDTRVEPTGMIDVTLNVDPAPAPTYSVVSGDGSSIRVTILDNDAPELSIASGPPVKESDVSGSPAQAIFTISSPVQPATNNFTVQYTPTSPNFVANSGIKKTSHTLDFADADNDGIFTAELRVNIVSDSTPELNEYLEVVLSPDTVGSEKYFVGSSVLASVHVEDDDASIPELSMASISDSIVESAGQVEFTIIASEAPRRDITVRYTPSEVGQGDFLTDAVATATDVLVSFQNVGGLEQATITVNLNNDSNVESTGMIKVTLNTDPAPAHTYTVVAGDSSYTMATILDNDQPTITISSTANNGVVVEGSNFTLTLTATPAPDSAFLVDINVAELLTTGHLSTVTSSNSNVITVASDGSAEVEIGTSGSVDITVATTNDTTNKRHGEIEVSLVAGTYTDYAVTTNMSQQAVAVKIEDQVVPEISISSLKDDSSITEGGSFKFLVEADIVPLTAISVNLEIDDNSTGHYKSITPTAPIAMLNVNSVEVTLATNDTTNEAHSAIEVSIDATNVTTYSASTSNDSISVGIVDSVKPEISISSTQHNGIVTEGGSFTFTLTADPVPYSTIMVDITAVDASTGHLSSLTASDSSSITVASDGSAQVEIGTGGTAQVTVSTTNDTTNVRHGVIDISIDSVTDAAYTVVVDPEDETDTLLNAIQVKIKDTVKPVISIATNSSKVSEGGSFTFSLSAVPASIAPISVDITATELVTTGHLNTLTGANSSVITVAGNGSAEVEIDTSGSVEVTVATTNETMRKRHGEIQVSLVEGTYTDYAITTNTSQQAVAVKVEDLIAPDISVSSTKADSSITEGESFKFMVEADIVPLTAISIKLTIDDNSLGHYKSVTPTAPIAMHNVSSVEVTLATNNTTTEAHSAIEVSIDATNVTTYSASTSNNSISVGIVDSVKPEISISSTQHDGIVTEGGSFTFILTADPVPYSTIMVDITAVDASTGHLSSLTASDLSAIVVAADGSAQVEIGVSGTTQVTVSTTNDTVNVRHGVIDISIDSVTDAAYTVVADPEDETDTLLNAIQVKIKDSVKPVISISSSRSKVPEGSSFTFSLSAVPAPIAPISVDITATELVTTGHLSTLTGPNSSVIVVAGNGSAEVEVGTSGSVDVTVATINDTTNKRHGEIKVSLVAGTYTDYSITTNTLQQAIEVKIEDQVAPTISITSLKADLSITEGESFKFTVSADIVPLTAISVKLAISDNGSGHYKSVAPTAPIAMLNANSVEVTLATNDTTNEAHSAIEVSIDATNVTTYSASTSNNSISVGIVDSVKPEISISSTQHDGIVTEGGSFTFTLNADPVPYSTIIVDITAVDASTGHLSSLTASDSSLIAVASDGSAQVEIGTGGTAQVTVSTTNDTTNVRHGVIDISIDSVTDAAYTVVADPEDETDTLFNAIQVKIKDTVKPVISISSSSSMISEGSSFTLSLSADPAPIAPISVGLTAAELVATGHLSILTGPNSRAITVASDGSAEVEVGTSGSVDVTVATINDTTNKRHGEIEVSLVEGTYTDFTITSNLSQQAVIVEIEDQVASVISISSIKDGQSITEGGSFVFRIEADLIPISPISVELDIDDDSFGHYKSVSPTAPIAMHNVRIVDVTLVTNNTPEVNHGEIEVSIIVTQATYTASANDNSITVGIEDSEVPKVSISTPQAQNDIVKEGNSFTFHITASPVPFSPITVNITVAEVIDTNHLGQLSDSEANLIYVSADGSAQVEIGTGGTGQFTLTTINDTTNKRHGNIGISLDAVSNADYEITTNVNQQAINVKVQDLATPIISISSIKDGNSITEGDNFSFRLEADLVVLTPIAVKLSLSDEELGDYIQDSTNAPISMHNVQFVDVIYDSSSSDDEVKHNEISISINDTDETTYTASETNNSITVKIRDSVIPVVSISPASIDSVISEGSNFNFTVTAEPAPISAIMVDISIVGSETGHLGQLSYVVSNLVSNNITVGEDGSASVEVGTSGSTVVTVATNNDTINKRNGEIEISLVEITEEAEFHYIIVNDETKIVFQVNIKDQIAPVISINSTKDGKSVTEGESFIFTVESDLVPLSPIAINLDIENDSGHFKQITPSVPIVLDNVTSKEITLATNNTDLVKHSEILISINDTNVTTYSASSPNNSIMVKIKDSNISTVSITSESNNGVITEGQNFEFKISAVPAPLEPIFVEFTTVDVNLTGHLGSLSSTSPVEIGANGFTRITVSTNLDAQYFRHGEIRITLNKVNNADYKIASEDNSNSIRILVKDREDPVVSITSNLEGLSIVEGETFYFNLMVKPVPVVPILVALNIDDGDLGYFGSLSIDTPVKLDGSHPVEVVLFTRIVSVVNEPGNINVQIGSAQNNEYEVSQANRSVSVVIEKDIKSVVSIAAHNQNLTAIEGESFRFSLYASPQPRIPIRVSLTANDGGTGHFARFLGPKQILVNTGGYGDGEISTKNISDKIGHGIITVTINPDPTYQISHTSSSIRVIILDNIESNVPEVSVKANPDSLANNDHAQFIFTAIPPPLDEIKVEILVSQQGGAVRWRVPTTIIMMSGRKIVSFPINMAINSASNPKISVMVVDHPHYIANSEVAEMTISDSSANLAQGDQTRIAIASQVADLVLQIQNDTLLEPEVSQSEINTLATPIVSISAVADSIQEGQIAQFRILSTHLISNSISIHVEQYGNFLNLTPPTQYSLNGENEGILELATIDNQIAEPDGKITVSINQGHGYLPAVSRSSASVIVTDNTDRKARQEQIALKIEQLLPQIDQAESELLNNALTNRMQSFRNEIKNSYFKLGGQQNMKSLIIETGETINSNDILVKRLLDQSSFEFKINSDSDFMNMVSVWGKSNFRNLNTVNNGTGDIGAGELFNGLFGVDTEIVPELVAGLGTSFTQTSVNLDSSILGDIEFQTNSTQFNPYIRWKSATSSSELRSVFSIGSGEITANQSGYESSTLQSELYSIAADGRVNLLREQENTEIGIAGQTNLKNIIVRGDENISEYIEMMSRFSRIGLEGVHNFDQIDGVTQILKSSIGIIETNISGQSVLLSELTGGIGYSSSLGFRFNGEGQISSNQIDKIYGWKLRSSFSYDRYHDNLGLVMTVDSKYCSKCAANSESLFGTSSLINSRQVRLEDDNIGINTNQISTEISYGIEIGDEIGQLNPFVRIEYLGNENPQQQIGGRVLINSNIKFELVGTHESKLGLNEVQSLKFKGFISW